MNGDGINFDQSDVDADFSDLHEHIKKIRKEFSEGKRNSKHYGSSEFEK